MLKKRWNVAALTVTTAFAVMAFASVMLMSCAGLWNGEAVTVTLPYLGNGYSRSISDDDIENLQEETASYRVIFETVSGTVTREGKGGAFSATFSRGMSVNVTVECLDKNGQVILRTVTKTMQVGTARNILTFNLKEDGTKIASGEKIEPDATPKNKFGIQMIELKGGKVPLASDYTPTVSSFYMSETEITQKQWRDVVENNGYGTQPSASYGVGDNFPMYYVNWYDALVFCNKLSIKENRKPCYSIDGNTNPDTWGTPPNSSGQAWNVICDWTANGYRLPTEAEWEYAARGGSANTYTTYSGTTGTNENALKQVAWYSPNSGSKANQVNTKSANANPIKDMSGNVWEWCWDYYSSSYDKNTTTDPQGVRSASKRVKRGGGYTNTAEFCAVDFRNGEDPYYRDKYYGLRVVCRP